MILSVKNMVGEHTICQIELYVMVLVRWLYNIHVLVHVVFEDLPYVLVHFGSST